MYLKCLLCKKEILENFDLFESKYVKETVVFECTCGKYRYHQNKEKILRDFLETDNGDFVIRRHFTLNKTDIVKNNFSEVSSFDGNWEKNLSKFFVLDRIASDDEILELRRHYNKLSVLL